MGSDECGREDERWLCSKVSLEVEAEYMLKASVLRTTIGSDLTEESLEGTRVRL